MITASHNPLPDNGVKLVDPQGEMLAPAWEAHATTLVNATDDGIAEALEAITSAAKINRENKALVIVGRDTRYIYGIFFVAFVMNSAIFTFCQLCVCLYT